MTDQALDIAPGAIVEVRDEQWLVSAIEQTAEGSPPKQLFDVGRASISRGFTSSDDEKADDDNALRERSLLDVGAARARDVLAISWSKTASPFSSVTEEVQS